MIIEKIKHFLSRLFRKPKSATSLGEILGLDGELDLNEETSLEDEEYRCFEFHEMEEYH